MSPKAVHINNHAELCKYLEKMNLRCADLKAKKDIEFYKKLEMEIIKMTKRISDQKNR